MQITIKRLSVPRKDDHIILLIRNEKEIPSSWFGKDELQFIRKDLKDDRKSIHINQYKRNIFIHLTADDAKEDYKKSEALRKSGAILTQKINQLKLEAVTLVSFAGSAATLSFAEGMILSNYQFLKYRSNADSEKNKLAELLVVCNELENQDLSRLTFITDAVMKARDLVNEPPMYLTATRLAESFVALGKASGFKTEVKNKKAITDLKMGGLIAVNLGSPEPPTFTIMEWKPAKATNKKPIVLIGKGVVYDTGGMSLKPTANSMDFMKCDMAGGAAVGAVMYAIAKAKLPVHVIGLVPATDNRPDGNAYVPGDVITMMNGKKVEVLNTDAEGRMILADAFHFAERYKPSFIIELSTLTGAASSAIGQYGIVAMGTLGEREKDLLKQSGLNVYERLAEFPFWDEFEDLIRSDVGDIKNTGGPVAGAITAGRFLSHFTNYPFMHLDIAGPAFIKSNDSYRGKNGSGVGVRLLFDFLKTLAEEEIETSVKNKKI